MTHQETVQNIASQLRKRRPHAPLSFVRQGVSHKVPNAHQQESLQKIQVPPLTRILEIDTQKCTCTAQSGVTFTDLVQETLKHGLVPHTVPELKTITIGGAVSGCSVESMSYKHGGFHDSCLEYEIITANGEVLTCSPQQNAEVFHMLHGSFGTLGVITKIKFKLHPARPFVKLTYQKYETFQEYQRAIQSEYNDPKHDFMDGIIHGPAHFTLCFGDFIDEAPYISDYAANARAGLKPNIYYKNTASRTGDYMKTHDYFFRYDTECHWISRNYGLENPILRFLAGRWFLSSTKMIKAAKKLRPVLKHIRPEVIVDVFIPVSRFQDFYDFYTREFNYWPLWIVPYRIANRYPWINENFMKDVPDELFIDCAIYGLKQPSVKDLYRLLDQKLIELKGIKTLISHNSYDEQTFWNIYSRRNYQAAKSLTDPDNAFKDLYEKTHSITPAVRT